MQLMTTGVRDRGLGQDWPVGESEYVQMHDRIGLRSTLERLRWVAQAGTPTSAIIQTVVTRGLSLVLNIGTGVICARSLGTQGRGEQTALGLWPELIAGLLTFGLPTALRYSMPRKRDEAGPLLSTAILFGVVLGCAAVVAGYIYLPIWLSKYPHDVVVNAQRLMFTAPLFMVTYMLQAFLEGRGDFRKGNLMFSFSAAATLSLLLAQLVAHRISPLGCALAYMLPPLAVTLWRVVEFRRFIRFPVAGLRRTAGDLFSYGLRVYGTDIIGTLATQVDQALVVRFLTGSGLGLYAIALAASRILAIFQGSIVVVLLPKAASMEAEDAVLLVTRAARLSLLVIGMLAALAALVVPIFIPLLYGRNFGPAIPVAQVLLAEAALGGTTLVLCQAFLSTGRPFVVTLLQAAGLATVIPLMVLMIPRLGLIGAALSLLISTALRLAVIMLCFPLLLRRAVPSLIPTRDDLRFVLARLGESSRAG